MLTPDYIAIEITKTRKIRNPLELNQEINIDAKLFNSNMGNVCTIFHIQAKVIEIVRTNRGQVWVITEGGKSIDVTAVLIE